MIPLSNPHTHTVYVDGMDTPEALVLAALENRFVSLGFSEHAPQPFDADYALDAAREQLYRADILQLKKAYASRIAIYLGIERDMRSSAARDGYDYIIASSHYAESDGSFSAVDGDAEALRVFVDRCYAGNGLSLAADYFNRFSEHIRTTRPDIIGHFDLVAKHNERLGLFDASGAEYLSLACDAMDRAIQGCDLMEVNTGAMARSGATAPYPALPLLKRWHTLGGRVILSSDCHNKAHLCFGYDKGLAVIREAGFREIWLLNPKSGPTFVRERL